MLRFILSKEKPNEIFYCCYKNFEIEKFEEQLKRKLLPVSVFESFYLAF